MTTVINVHDVAAELAAERDTFWTGPSGETVTGGAAARHLDAVRKLLERDGWVRNYGNDDPTVELPDENASVKDMIRQLFQTLRDVIGADKRRTLLTAMSDVASSDNGDYDTQAAAECVLNVVLRARSGSTSAFYGAWASKVGRTWEQVSGLLEESADFARAHGPAA